MSLDDDIKDLVLGFFAAIDSNISENNGLYQISIPESYQSFFQRSDLLIAFEKETSSQHDCELVVAGNRTLSLILEDCTQRGPIALKKFKTGRDRTVARYHFFVSFSGTSSMTNMESIFVDLDTSSPTSVHRDYEDAVFSLQDRVDPEKITPSYIAALDDLKSHCDNTRLSFLADANKKFQHDFELFVHKHDAQVRELDVSINEKDRRSDDPDKIREFRFETVDKIQDMKKEKIRLVEILQEKHKILLEYSLVACEIIST